MHLYSEHRIKLFSARLCLLVNQSNLLAVGCWRCSHSISTASIETWNHYNAFELEKWNSFFSTMLINEYCCIYLLTFHSMPANASGNNNKKLNIAAIRVFLTSVGNISAGNMQQLKLNETMETRTNVIIKKYIYLFRLMRIRIVKSISVKTI